MLVDEFQDTDPIQWEILQRAFGDGGATLVLIGDPKQAIYSFRGADVYAYLDAAAQRRPRAARWTSNWRSDQRLLDAFDALFASAHLGHAGIVYRPVRAADANQAAASLGRAGGRAAARAGAAPRPTGSSRSRAAAGSRSRPAGR